MILNKLSDLKLATFKPIYQKYYLNNESEDESLSNILFLFKLHKKKNILIKRW